MFDSHHCFNRWKGKLCSLETKEIVCRVHEYFQSEYDDAKNVGQVGLQQTSSNVSFKNLIEFHFKMFNPICLFIYVV